MIFCSNIPNELLSKISKILSTFDEFNKKYIKTRIWGGVQYTFPKSYRVKKDVSFRVTKTLHLQCRYTHSDISILLSHKVNIFLYFLSHFVAFKTIFEEL